MNQDKQFLEASIPELQDFLLSKEIFWTLSARGTQLPRLTLGGLLLAQRRLSALGLDAHTAAIEEIRSKWRTAWETKAGREVRTRCDLWKNYLKDYDESPGQNARDYPHEVQWRVMLELLLDEVKSNPSKEAMLMKELDQTLRAILVPGVFIWDVALESGFPKEKFWFLYGTLKDR